jgi:pilus assembly protein FimV
MGTADTAPDDNAESLLDQVLDENKLLDKRPGGRPASDYSDDDIAAWIKELGAEVDHVEEQSANDEALVDDDDIPSILNELDDQLGGRETTATPPRIHLEPLDGASGTDDEVPELLHEIDDQLAAPGGTGAPDQTGTAKPVPDDFAEQAFSMSLDLARAYLEIGDPDGARDMLQQALSGARDPNHRRQIEEMLKQID